jgi:hypothetical protein
MDDKECAGKRFLTPMQPLRCLVQEDKVYDGGVGGDGVHVSKCSFQSVQSATRCSCLKYLCQSMTVLSIIIITYRTFLSCKTI